MLEFTPDVMLLAGLVDIDGSFVVQLAVFIVFAVLLNFILVRPLLRAQELRFGRMAGARQDAERLDLEAARTLSSYEKRLAQARQAAVSIREELRAVADEEASRSVAAMQEESARILEAGRAELRDQADRMRLDLSGAMDELADRSVARILDEGGEA